MASPLVSEEISQEAITDAVYNMLSFYHALSVEGDPAAYDFIPLTTIRVPRADEVKIMAVGLLPPSVPITDRLLKRAASVSALDRTLEAKIEPLSVGPTLDPTRKVASKPPPHSPEFWDRFVRMCNRLGCEPEQLAHVIQSESNFDPTAVAWRKNDAGQDVPVGRGLIQLVRKTAYGLGMSEETYDGLQGMDDISQLEWVEKFYGTKARGKTDVQLKGIAFGGYADKNPDNTVVYHGSATKLNGYPSAAFQEECYKKNEALDRNPKKGYISVDDVSRAVTKHPLASSIASELQAAKTRVGMSTEGATPVTAEPGGSAWVDNGSMNAADAQRTVAQRVNKVISESNLGQSFAKAQNDQLAALKEALKRISEAKPLRLLVNPQSFRFSAEQMISEGNWGRSGPVIEHWGCNQDKIEASGRIGAFFALDQWVNATGPGLTRTARNYSASYQNLLSLYFIYRNNGAVYLPDPFSSRDSKSMNMSIVGSIYLYYDDVLYIGSFDTFTLSESDSTPYTLEYSFAFTVQAWFLLDQPENPNFNYRSPPPLRPTAAPAVGEDNTAWWALPPGNAQTG